MSDDESDVYMDESEHDDDSDFVNGVRNIDLKPARKLAELLLWANPLFLLSYHVQGEEGSDEELAASNDDDEDGSEAEWQGGSGQEDEDDEELDESLQKFVRSNKLKSPLKTRGTACSPVYSLSSFLLSLPPFLSISCGVVCGVLCAEQRGREAERIRKERWMT